MARAEIPEGEFVHIDVMDFKFPKGIDAVFAFASLLHSPKEDLAIVLEKVACSLNPGGVMLLSLKHRKQYGASLETDDHVSRQFYYYSWQAIDTIVPLEMREVFYSTQSRKDEWLTMILQKK